MTLLVRQGWIADSPFVDRRVVVAPAHPTNYYTDRACRPIALFWHEPQEPADDYESTPVWFATFHANPAQRGSTTFYGDTDGDRYQCVPLDRAPIANGWTGDLPIPRFADGGPEFGPYSLNEQSWSDEEEGFTATIHRTMTNAQYQGAVDLAVFAMVVNDWPRNPRRVGLAHADVASNRSDGVWIARKSGIPQEAVNRVLKLEQDINELKAYVARDAVKLNSVEAALQAHAALVDAVLPPLAHGDAATADARLRFIYAAAGKAYPYA